MNVAKEPTLVTIAQRENRKFLANGHNLDSYVFGVAMRLVDPRTNLNIHSFIVFVRLLGK